MRNFNKPSRQRMDQRMDQRMNQRMDQLTEKLAKAYRSKGADDMPPPEKWRQNVMRSIRQMGTLEEKNNRERFGYLTWRLAPVAAVLLILMSIWTKQVDDTLEFQIASLIVNDPAQADVYDPF